ncbi:alpha/beta fold hydrolase [Streptomyces tsukubensis]|uniref:Alpha/beta hydrolase n=1 Tax=Streptomyces tsukubensis TaxID=83656 RepID=A0A1V4AD02_9ACTN|nr:alpha/beta hydrolase [Streptomyces tsukubensis]OON81287.1 alpha/beta hydrolase [Streptomyces tsukubensis]QFR95598.1 alpha/beta fold hydrolase [Streptomyces tsukubensis]
MSRPPTFTPPSCARAARLATSRGDFAILDAPPRGDHSREPATVLLLPGFTGSKEDFIALLDPLSSAGYRTVAVDGRGQYETAGPDDPAPYAQRELALDVLAQVEALGPPVHLLGHSLGGQIARAAVLMDPAPFASLTLMSSGPAKISRPQRERVKLLSDALSVMDMAQVWAAIESLDPPEEAETGAAAQGPVARDPAVAAEADLLRTRWMRHNAVQLITTGAQLTKEPDRVAELAALPVPVHVISGESDDTWPVPLFDDMAVRLGAERTVIKGAGHSPNTDRPPPTATALTGFWDRHRA